MPKLSKKKINLHLSVCNSNSDASTKGKALEDLICYVFEKVPGICVTARDQLNFSRSEEIDVAFWNDSDPKGLHFLQNLFIVECKNWSSPLGSSEVNWFYTKIKNRGLTYGILIAANGITGNSQEKTASHQIIARALSEKVHIVVITNHELSLLNNTEELVILIKTKLCQLVASGTIFL